MKLIVNLFIALAIICFFIAIISRITSTGLYEMGVKPVSALVFGNSCLLLALVLNSIKK